MHARYWKAGLLAVIAAAGGLLVLLEERTPAPASSSRAPSAPAPAASPLSVPQRSSLGDYRPVAPETPAKQLVPSPAAAVEPAMPPVPYRFAGTLGQQVFLAKDTAIIGVAPGEILDELYRVESIDDKGISLTYLPLGKTVVIDLQAAPAPPR
jgi:hypothetical protein